MLPPRMLRVSLLALAIATPLGVMAQDAQPLKDRKSVV